MLGKQIASAKLIGNKGRIEELRRPCIFTCHKGNFIVAEGCEKFVGNHVAHLF